MSKEQTKLQTIPEWNTFLGARVGKLDQWSAGTGLDGRTLARVAVRAMTDPKTQKLRECTPASLYLALSAAAQLGLDPSGTEAALVPYGKVATFAPMFQGLIKLAMRSRKVRAMWADVVRDGDEFRVVKGTSPSIHHVPSIETAGRELVAVYACAQLAPHGFVQFDVLSPSEVELARSSSPSASRADSPWNKFPAEMWKKTAIKRLAKYLPKSSKLQQAIDIDNAVERGEFGAVARIIDVGDDAVTDEPSDPGKGTDGVRSALEGAR